MSRFDNFDPATFRHFRKEIMQRFTHNKFLQPRKRPVPGRYVPVNLEADPPSDPEF